MTSPRGELVLSRVVSDPETALTTALERRLTGCVVFEPQDSLLLDASGYGVLTFEDGIPIQAHHTGTGRGGPEAVADLAVPGPYSVELYRQSPDERDADFRTDERPIPPGMPAERLAGDPTLAEKTRERAPERSPETTSTSAVEAFLEDEEKIAAIREQARQEAERRAAEWGLDDQLS
ncbi:hypothetical protein A4G99_17345 [Haladaptatus sp. R4]|uniref:hypothetical protein n=1 Tax=Haladaptatus sp. R4 TaxID=1679489 RepID=UPI0007B49410|nr:hypothetical protein [Haladaptatus sp. R4]KZN22867.1 hypothetical protein A4G99_17345 [Haladaptatus sp. R4]